LAFSIVTGFFSSRCILREIHVFIEEQAKKFLHVLLFFFVNEKILFLFYRLAACHSYSNMSERIRLLTHWYNPQKRTKGFFLLSDICMHIICIQSFLRLKPIYFCMGLFCQ